MNESASPLKTLQDIFDAVRSAMRKAGLPECGTKFRGKRLVYIGYDGFRMACDSGCPIGHSYEYKYVYLYDPNRSLRTMRKYEEALKTAGIPASILVNDFRKKSKYVWILLPVSCESDDIITETVRHQDECS